MQCTVEASGGLLCGDSGGQFRIYAKLVIKILAKISSEYFPP
jgi:hypothetical protein